MPELRPSSTPAALRILLGPAAIALLTGAVWLAQSHGQVVPNAAVFYLLVLVGVCLTGGVISALVNVILSVLAILLLYHEVGRLGSSGEPLVRLLIPLIAFSLGSTVVVLLRRRLERALAAPVEAERKLFQAMMASMHDAIVETDWKGIRDVNASFCTMTGFSREELLGAKAPFPFWPIEQYAAIAAALETSMRGSALDFELVLSRKNGERFPVLLSVSRILDTAGAAKRILYSFREITELKRAQEQLRESERTRQQAIDAARMGTWDWDLKTNRVQWAGHQEALWGMKPGEFDGSYAMVVSRMDPRDLKVIVPANDEFRRRRVGIKHEFRVIWPDGSVHWIAITGAHIFDATGEAIRVAGVSQDVTERRHTEMLLAAEGQILEKIARGTSTNATLDALVHMIETLLAGSLCSILTLNADGRHLHIAAAPSLPQEFNDNVEGFEIGPSKGSCGTAVYEGKRIIISDIQTDPRWECAEDLAAGFGLRSCTSEPIRARDGSVLGTLAIYFKDVREPSSEQLRVLEMAAQLAAIAIERDHEERELRDAKEAAEIANRTKDDFLNLLSHELRSPLTPILTLASVLENDSRLPEDLRADMEMIRRNAEIEARLIDDLLELVRAAKGPLSNDIESNVRDVRQIARAERAESGDAPRAFEPAQKPLRILIVEDHADSSKILARMLIMCGHTVTAAVTVAEALEKGTAQPFDLLLIDLGLPDGTGLELLQKLRISHPIPAIALSGFGTEEDIQRSLAAGFVLHITKPFNFHTLHDAIERFTS